MTPLQLFFYFVAVGSGVLVCAVIGMAVWLLRLFLLALTDPRAPVAPRVSVPRDGDRLRWFNNPLLVVFITSVLILILSAIAKEIAYR